LHTSRFLSISIVEYRRRRIAKNFTSSPSYGSTSRKAITDVSQRRESKLTPQQTHPVIKVLIIPEMIPRNEDLFLRFFFQKWSDLYTIPESIRGKQMIMIHESAISKYA
jgi:hypothetical protein